MTEMYDQGLYDAIVADEDEVDEWCPPIDQQYRYGIEHAADKAAHIVASRPAMPSDGQISIEWTCCGDQEYWPLNSRGELEMTHEEVGVKCSGEVKTSGSRQHISVSDEDAIDYFFEYIQPMQDAGTQEEHLALIREFRSAIQVQDSPDPDRIH